MMERIYSRRGYLGKEKRFRKYKRDISRVQRKNGGGSKKNKKK